MADSILLNMKHFVCLIILLMSLTSNTVTAAEMTFTESNEDFNNPDRGFYYPYTTLTSGFTPLNYDDLVNRRTTAYTPFNANYTVTSTIALRHYVMDSYRSTDTLPAAFLDNIQTDFSTARDAGVRLIVRFSYNTQPVEGDCAVGFICPPYLDAPKPRVLSHIQQLASVLSINSDVITGLQHGFIGMWGENYYSDYFGDASPNADIGRFTNQNWLDRNDVIAALLEAVPDNRMLQLRFAQSKHRFLEGPTTPLTQVSLADATLSEEQAFNNSDIARLGLHNDCFLASSDDFGTFADYGNDTGVFASNAQALLKTHVETDSAFTLIGGETCSNETYEPQNNCESDPTAPGIAIAEMEKNHYTYLNSDYNNLTNNDWVSGACMDEVKQRLGYRLVLRNVSIDDNASNNGVFNINMQLSNVGFAAPINPRQLWFVLRHQDTQNEHRFLLEGQNTNPQRWLAGETFDISASPMLSVLSQGTYSLYLHVADPSENNRILNRPEFSVQFANTNIWESSTGYNNLNLSVYISESNALDSDILDFIPAIISNTRYKF